MKSKRRPRTYKPATPNQVHLRDVPLRLLFNAHTYMVAEVEACDDHGICSEERPAYVALANACARELRRRGRAPKYKLPTPPSAADEETEW